ncbi:YfiR family protein [Neptunomonas sp.]|uniref:YfiR family protein n=1 Tax=Neptunomonas sp. TaxID=1971898 RepID=UPI0025D8E393|nr:YfiR family protein [Neptunomonas sp.]
MMRKLFIKLILLLGVLFFIPFSTAVNAQSADIYQLKAALLYNFTKFTKWPNGSIKKSMAVCYFSERYKPGMERLSGKKISQLKISIKQIKNINDVEHCNLLFIDKSQREILNRLFIKVKGKPILTVSDISGFYDEGGMIEITVRDNRLRFLIDLEAVGGSDIVLSSQMLKLAVEVKH